MQIQGGFGIPAMKPMSRISAGEQSAQISHAHVISKGLAPLSGESKQLVARASQMKGGATSVGPSMMGPELFSKLIDQSSPSQMQAKSSGTKSLIFAVLEGVAEGLGSCV